MKGSLILLISSIVFTNTGFANNELSQNSNLYKKLESLFQDSHEPFDLEEHAVTSLEDPTLFDHCLSVSKDGKKKRVKNVISYGIKFTKKEDNGPLDPPEFNTFYTFNRKEIAVEAVRRGAHFQGNLINSDAVKFSIDPTCESPNNHFLLNSSSGISKDGTSYVVTSRCNDHRIFQIKKIKAYENYLLAQHEIMKDKTNSEFEYTYCWNDEN